MTSHSSSPLILVVDDEKHLCWVLSKILSAVGYRVRIAYTGKDALQVCAQEQITAAIIDYRLPDMDGITLFQKLSATGRPHLGILVSSYGTPTLPAQAVSAGFLGYFDKPFRNDHLLAFLAKIIAQSRENR